MIRENKSKFSPNYNLQFSMERRSHAQGMNATQDTPLSRVHGNGKGGIRELKT